MRILIYGINFAPELTGIGKYTGEMAAFLAQKGHEVRVVTAPPYYPHWRIQPGYAAGKYKAEIWQGTKVYRCPLWLPGGGRKVGRINGLQRVFHLASFALSSLPVILRQVSWHPQRVIVLAPSVFNAPAAALVARLAKGKSWLHIQDFELDAALGLKIFPGLGPGFQLGLMAERWLYRRFDHVSTISNRMLERLKAKGVDSEKVTLFPNWVDTQQIFPLTDYNDLRQELLVSDQEQVILYSGNMGQKQGLEILVEAARQLRNESRIIFILCGEGAVKAELEDMARGLANVRFIPLQPLDRLNRLLNLAAVHVIPQSASAADLVMPSKLGGILASGRPVIVTASEGTELADVVRPLGKVIPPGRADCLADTILELAHQPALQATLGKRGRVFVESTWAKETVLEKFLQVLQSL
jgi:colanic acid biosynthesis glycosyl transferase WcaI